MSYDIIEASTAEGRPYYLYQFIEGADVWRFTSRADVWISTGSGGDIITWRAAAVAHGDVVQTSEIERGRLELTWPLSHPFARRFLAPLGNTPVTLTIFRGHEQVLGETVAHWKGRVVEYMSAGSGVTHSEFNPSATDEMRFLQVWLVPEVENTQPTYDTMDLTSADKDGKLKLFLSKDGRDGSMKTQADASVYAATLSGDQMITQDLTAGRKAWVQVAGGSVRVNEIILNKGDGLAIDGTGALTFDQGKDAEFLFFDLAP